MDTFAHLEGQLISIGLQIEDRTGLAELRGLELWFRTSRHGRWSLAGQFDAALVECDRTKIVELLEVFNSIVREGGLRRRMPKLRALRKGHLPANEADARVAKLRFDVALEAMQVVAKNERWAKEHQGPAGIGELRAAVAALALEEVRQAVDPGTGGFTAVEDLFLGMQGKGR